MPRNRRNPEIGSLSAESCIRYGSAIGPMHLQLDSFKLWKSSRPPGRFSWPIARVAVSGATRNYLGIAYVFPLMQKVIPSMSRWTVAIGAAVFIGVLFISAYWEADIRWLHFFQAWMYLATIILAWKGSRWGTSSVWEPRPCRII
jgi:hypothetical protein